MARLVVFLQFFLVSAAWGAEPSVGDLARAVHETAADPTEIYRVRDLNFTREDIKVYLTEGYVMFSKPIEGRRVWAAFSSDVEGGDAEVIVLPPTRSERASLAGFIQSPNLDEHVRSAFMVFTDGTADQLLEQIQKEGTGRKALEMGPAKAAEWTAVATNIAAPMQLRLVEDILSPAGEGSLAFLAFSGKALGNFDIIMDGREENQIAVRHHTERDGKLAYELWTSFPARSARNGRIPISDGGFTLSNYRIDASLDALLRVTANTKVALKVGAKARRVFSFSIANAMQIRSAKIDGQPAEVLLGESMRSRIVGVNEEQPVLVVASSILDANSSHEFEFEHEGNVITTAGNGVYFVNARGSWYPHIALGVTTFDLRFRYPRRLTLVTAGDPVEDTTDGDWRITRRKISVPIASAGFNLGDYEKTVASAAGMTIDVYGNRAVEDSLRPRVVYLPVPPPVPPMARARGRGMGGPPVDTIPMMQMAPDPLGRLKAVASDMTSSMEYYAGMFGPPAIKHVTVAPIPGSFGQGFPGLVYMSTFAYLDPQDRPAALRTARERIFYSDLIVPHEAAHQWWGAVVTIERSADAWLLEGLANYSALMWIEKKKGAKEVQLILNGYRSELVDDTTGKGVAESAGPIVWGDRLTTAENPDAWRAITYAKGSWILHMLRKRMGDERFIAMLAELRNRYEFKVLTTEGFRALAIEFRPKGLSADSMESFFDNWVYSTGVPALKVKSSIKPGAASFTVSGTLEQSGVDEDFSVDVPIDVQMGRGATQTIWVRSSAGETPFSATFKLPPTKVGLSDAILTKK
ncbi:MAG: M1 family aminopeptidase [Bryobacteraceae bacterium]